MGFTQYKEIIVPRLYQLKMPNRNEWDFLKTTIDDFNSNANGIYSFHPERPTLTLFIGDSHIAQYAERIAKLTDQPQRSGVILALGGGCIPIENVYTEDVRRKGCWDIREKGFKLSQQEQVKSVVFGGNWAHYFLFAKYNYENRLPIASPEGKKAAFAQFRHQIESLIKSGKKVYLLIGNPSSRKLDPAGYKIRFSSAPNFTSNFTVEIPTEQFELRNELLELSKQTGVIPIDPFQVLCDEKRCRATTESRVPIFQDESHFNPDWAIDGTDFMDMTTVP